MTTTTLPVLYDADLLALIRNTDGSEPCATTDPDLFHTVDGASNHAAGVLAAQRKAAALCRGCHLLDQCRGYAMTHPVSGVWGATSERDRDALREAAA